MSELSHHVMDDILQGIIGVFPEAEPELYRELAQECREVWLSGSPLRPWADQKRLERSYAHYEAGLNLRANPPWLCEEHPAVTDYDSIDAEMYARRNAR